MKIDCSRHLVTGQTDGQSDSLVPVGAKKTLETENAGLTCDQRPVEWSLILQGEPRVPVLDEPVEDAHDEAHDRGPVGEDGRHHGPDLGHHDAGHALGDTRRHRHHHAQVVIVVILKKYIYL